MCISPYRDQVKTYRQYVRLGMHGTDFGASPIECSFFNALGRASLYLSSLKKSFFSAAPHIMGLHPVRACDSKKEARHEITNGRGGVCFGEAIYAAGESGQPKRSKLKQAGHRTGH